MKFLIYHATILIFSLFFTTASAQNYTLTSNGDTHAVSPTTSPNDASSQITLRSAIEAATQRVGTHVITIPASITTINLTLGLITAGSATVGNNITINGPGKTVLTINQTTGAKIFSTGNDAVTFSVNNLTLNYAGPVVTISGGGGAIVAGGTNAVTSLNNVAINNFKIQIGSGGAISASSSVPHTLSISNCDFNNNYCGGAGGAVSFNCGNGVGSCTITNSTFTNNQTGPLGANTGGSGGAISTTGIGVGGIYSVTNCTFTNNKVLAASAGGGAIVNNNGALTVNFCRFSGNNATTATNGNCIVLSGGVATNTINANNNWWGQNGPATNDNITLPSSGTLTCAKWLQLKTATSPTSVCPGATSTITASFLSNSASEAISTSNLIALIGRPITFTNAILGTLSGAQATIQSSGTATATFTAGATNGAGSANALVDNLSTSEPLTKASIAITVGPFITLSPVQSTTCLGLASTFNASATNYTSLVWQESANSSFSSPTNLSNGGIYSGATTTPLNISDNTTVNGRYYRLVATNTNGCGPAVSSGAQLNATAPGLSANNTITQTINTNNNLFFSGSCGAICKVVPFGTSPISGSVTTQVWVEGVVPTHANLPYVQRHYQITPGTLPTTATALVTLYFSQAEFNSFNAHAGSLLNLPTGTGDVTGKANLRIGKLNGSSNNSTGLPSSYNAGTVIINPDDTGIVYNASLARWEITFPVAGFSGFIVQTLTTPLPLKLLSFSGVINNGNAMLSWEIAQAEKTGHFSLQLSRDGSDYKTINEQETDLYPTQFSYSDHLTFAGSYFYRLKMTDNTGEMVYSNVVALKSSDIKSGIIVYPNPASKGERIIINLQNAEASKIELFSMWGQKIFSADNLSGEVRIPISNVASGWHFLKIHTNGVIEIHKLIIQ